MFTLLIFLAVLALLVLSHEWGHFIVARRQGIKVEEFGFGFPPRLLGVRFYRGRPRFIWGKRRPPAEPEAPTLYSFNLLPLGGFVRIKGEDAASGDDDPDSFAARSPLRKSAVLLAGVVMNVLVAFVLLSVAFMVGFPASVSPDAETAGPTTLRVLQIIPDKPAAAVGILSGDAIVRIGDIPRPRLQEMQAYVSTHRNEEIEVVVERNGEQLLKHIRPALYEDTGAWGIGVALTEIGLVRYPWPTAFKEGAVTTGIYLKEIVFAFGYLLKGFVTGAGVTGTVAGPVGVAVMTGEVARLGWVYLIQFTALLSLNLAVLNALPIPALDGGRFLFVVLSAIRRRQFAPRTEQLFHTASFALLILLVIAVTVKDLGAFSGVFASAWRSFF